MAGLQFTLGQEVGADSLFSFDLPSQNVRQATLDGQLVQEWAQGAPPTLLSSPKVCPEQPVKVQLPLRARRCLAGADEGSQNLQRLPAPPPATPPRRCLQPPTPASALARSPISLADALSPSCPSPPAKVVSLERELTQSPAVTPSVSGSPVRFPPGLEPPPGTPSHGSVLHSSGGCQPCAWFWKPSGCQNGQDCKYCHVCPEGEAKLRKKAKQCMLREFRAAQSGRARPVEVSKLSFGCGSDFGVNLAEAIPSDQESTAGPNSETLSEDEQELFMAAPAMHSAVDTLPSHAQHSPGMLASPPILLESPLGPPMSSSTPPPTTSTPGSALHGLGQCKPCAWFRKTGGCQRGQGCTFCHLCPDGELKARKKTKHALMRLEKTMLSDAAAVAPGLCKTNPLWDLLLSSRAAALVATSES